MDATPNELKKILVRLRLIDSGINNTLQIFYPPQYYLEDCKQFNYVAAMPNYIQTVELILDEVSHRISSINNKRHLIFANITRFDDHDVESFYDEYEDETFYHLLGITVIQVDDILRKKWYKEIMPELQEYDNLLIKHRTGILPKYFMSDKLALWISKFEVGNNECLFVGERSQSDFILLVTSPELTASEISRLKIKFGTNNRVSAYILRELADSDFLKLNFREIERMGCFITKSGSTFSAGNFEADLSKFKMSLNTSLNNNELVTEISQNISKLIKLDDK